jgi:integrase
MSKKTRRISGTGSVFPWKKRNPKTSELEVVGWCAVADLGIVDGNRARKTKYGQSQKELAKWLTDTLRDHEHGVLPSGGALTVGTWLEQWLRAKEIGSKQIRPRTLEHYRLVVKKHIAPAIGQRPLAKLTPSDVERMLGAQLKAGRSPRSVSHVRAVLRNALSRAERDGKVSRNAARLAEPPSVPEPDRSSVEAFSERVPAFLRAIEGDRLAAMYTVTLALGLRIGEVTGLRWSDMDLDAGTLRINKSLQWIRPTGRKHALPHLVDPKTEKSRRVLELSEPLVDTVRQHRARWRDEKLTLGPRSLNEWDLAFTGPLGEPLNPRAISEQLRSILARAGLPRIRFHDLRHANASLMLSAHVPMEMLSRLLGHSNPTTTRNIYAHVLKPLVDEAKRAQASILTLSAQ